MKKKVNLYKNGNYNYAMCTYFYIGYMFIISMLILVISMVSNSSEFYKNNELLLLSNKNGNSYVLNSMGITLVTLVSIAFVASIVFVIFSSMVKTNAFSKRSLIITISILVFVVFTMFIILMLSNTWNSKGAIIKNFLSMDKNNSKIQLSGAAMSILLYSVVSYGCLIVSIANLIISFKKRKANDFLEQNLLEENN